MNDPDFEKHAKQTLHEIGQRSAASSGPSLDVRLFAEWVRSERARREALRDRHAGAGTGGFFPPEEKAEKGEDDKEDEGGDDENELEEWEKDEDVAAKTYWQKRAMPNEGDLRTADDQSCSNTSPTGVMYYAAVGVALDWDNPADRNQKFQLLRRAIVKYLKEIGTIIECFYYVRAPM
jgi:hypothetical protein